VSENSGGLGGSKPEGEGLLELSRIVCHGSDLRYSARNGVFSPISANRRHQPGTFCVMGRVGFMMLASSLKYPDCLERQESLITAGLSIWVKVTHDVV
jgi:hypothetical protein